MNKSKIFLCVLIMSISMIVLTRIAIASCGENSNNGKVDEASLSTFLDKQSEFQYSDNRATYVFVEQSDKKYYAKVCNDTANISHFMNEHTSGKGDWGSCSEVSTRNALKKHVGIGVYRIEKLSKGKWRICEYK